jgi:hypothetical protein
MEISDQTTCLDPFFPSFEESLSSRNYKPDTLANYRYLLRRFGRLLETEGISPSALTPDLAVELGRRLPTTPKSQIKIPNLARLFVAHLIEIGVAIRPPLSPAQAERAELLANFETYLLRQRGLPRSAINGRSPWLTCYLNDLKSRILRPQAFNRLGLMPLSVVRAMSAFPKSGGIADVAACLKCATGLNRSRGKALQQVAGWGEIRGASCLKMRSCNPPSRQEPPHDRPGNEPVTPAHDRRHDDPEVRTEDPT